MFLEGVKDILEEEEVGIAGKTLFINFMPADYNGILLRNPFGGTKIDYELSGMRSTEFMLIVRHPEPAVAKAIMAAAMTALTIEGKQRGGMHINYMRPRTEPLEYQPSVGDNIEMITNIDVNYVLL